MIFISIPLLSTRVTIGFKFLSNDTLAWSLIVIEEIPVRSSVTFSILTPSTKSTNLTIPAVSVIIGVVYGSHVTVV